MSIETRDTFQFNLHDSFFQQIRYFMFEQDRNQMKPAGKNPRPFTVNGNSSSVLIVLTDRNTY